jgi:hypothetical protein
MMKKLRSGLRRNANAEDRQKDPKLCTGGIQRRKIWLKRVLAVLYTGNIPIRGIRDSPIT